VIKVTNLTVRVNGYKILENFSMDVGEGELALITGNSGSGKSLVLKVLSGLIDDLYRGVTYEGFVEVHGLNPVDAWRKGIVTYIPQDLSNALISSDLLSELKVFKVSPQKILELTRFLSGRLNLSIDFHALSAGQKFLALISSAIALGFKVILIDEPTSYLDLNNLRDVIALLKKLAGKLGLTIVIADRSPELTRYVDKVFLLEKEVSCRPIALKEVVGGYLNFSNVWFKYPNSREWVLRDVNLRVEAGEVTLVVGPNGSGKSTLLKVASGMYKQSKGEVLKRGRIFYIPQEPLYWMALDTVEDEVRFRGLNPDLISSAGLNSKKDVNPHALSVGEVRRLSIFLAYASGSPLVLIDEVSLGLDKASFTCIEELIEEASARNIATVITSHNLIKIKHSKVVALDVSK